MHATDLLRTGKWDLTLVQERLGHRSIVTTANYLHLLDEDVKAAHQDYLRRRAAREQKRRGAVSTNSFGTRSCRRRIHESAERVASLYIG